MVKEAIQILKRNKDGDITIIMTGELSMIDDDWVEIKSIKGEIRRFRKEQIQERIVK